jgi:phosphoglycolate phosphatase-like HAD superfamily hydrolase
MPTPAPSLSCGVIFDVDGTLIDSNDAHAYAWLRAFRELGRDIGFADVRPLIGMGGDKILPQLLGVSDESELGQRVSRRRAEIFASDYLPELRPFPRVRELAVRLRDGGARLAVASSAQPNELQPLLKLAEIEDLIEVHSSSGDAENSKPDPDIIHAALGRLRLPPAQAFMVGDTPYDVAAARKAEVRTIAFRCGGRDDRELAGALAIYDDPAELLEQLSESPIFRV